MFKIGNSQRKSSPSRMRRKKRSAFVALSALTMIAVTATPALAASSPMTPLPENASASELKWQPVLDYDTDSCYPVAAIDPTGKVNKGLKNTGSITGGCRNVERLHETNSYSREYLFESGWSAIVYGLYFEKDQVVHGLDAFGHRHDWEHVVVWVIRGKAEWVAVSQHGGYSIRRASDVLWEGTHPKIVYHKDGAGTHALRFDAGREGSGLQNALKQWQRPPLVGWEGFTSIDLRKKLTSNNFGSAHMDIKDERFRDAVFKAMPKEIR